MALEIKREGKETPQSLIRRFLRRVKQSGILLEARKNLFLAEKKSENMKKRAALRREELRKKYEKLEKLGQLKK